MAPELAPPSGPAVDAARDIRWPELLGIRSTAAIMVVDLVESTLLTARHGDDFIARWQRLARDIEAHARSQHGGRLMRSMGDGLLLTFPGPLAAVRAAQHVQRDMARHNVARPAEQAMRLRIALHVDTVLVDDTDIHGFGLALATRLLSLASPDEIVCSEALRAQLTDGLAADFEDLGPVYLKHVEEPVRAYRVHEVPAAGAVVSMGPSQRVAPPDPRGLRLAVAVLPFECDADADSGPVVGEMLADQLIAALSRGSHLRVTSRLSSRAVAGHGLTMQAIASRLQVAYLVSGRLVQRGHRLSLMVELASADDESVVWAEQVGAEIGQLLAGDESFAPQLASSLCTAILNRQLARVRQQPLPSLEGHALLLGGIALMHRFSRRDFDRARDCLEALSERAPRHAEPYAWLARWHVFRTVQGWTGDADDERNRARDLCRRALDLDPESSLAMTIAGSVETTLNHDIDRAQAWYRDALRVDPSEPLAWLLLGTSHSFKGEGDEAVRCCGRATALTPLDPMRFYYDTHSAAAYVAAGDHRTAIEFASRALRSNVAHHSTLRTLAIAQSLAGEHEAAGETVRRIRAAQPDLTVSAFLRQSPAASFAHGRRLAEALRQAGLPD